MEYLDKTHDSGQTKPLASNNYGLRVKLKGTCGEIIEQMTAALKD